MLYVGQKVLCVRAAGCLVERRTYKITAIDPKIWVRVNCCAKHQKVQAGWLSSRFRPLTDISIFTNTLKAAPLRELA